MAVFTKINQADISNVQDILDLTKFKTLRVLKKE